MQCEEEFGNKDKVFISWLEQYKWLVYSPSQQGGYKISAMVKDMYGGISIF